MAGRARLEEKQQAEADKEVEDVSVVTAASADLKPGERRVISDGTNGPVVEIIKKTTSPAYQDAENNKYSDNDDLQEDAEAEESGE